MEEEAEAQGQDLGGLLLRRRRAPEQREAAVQPPLDRGPPPPPGEPGPEPLLRGGQKGAIHIRVNGMELIAC